MTVAMIALLIIAKLKQKTTYVLAEEKATLKAEMVEINCGYHQLIHEEGNVNVV